MILKQFLDDTSKTFTYILAAAEGKDAIIIDPVLEGVDDYLQFLGSHNLRLIKALDTHIHADHFTGLSRLRELTKCMIIASQESAVELASQRIKDGDSLEVDGFELKAIYTPGHTIESYCFYTQGFIFTGDTLFIRGNGRTDFQNGSAKQLYESITQKLFILPADTVVCPGHDYKGENFSTIGREIEQNPRLAGKTCEEFIEIMNNLNLPNPKLMDVAVPANLKTGTGLKESLHKSIIFNRSDLENIKHSFLLVDLREAAEIGKTGMLPGAVHIPYKDLIHAIGDPNSSLMQAYNKGDMIIFYCAYGERSALAIKIAKENKLEKVGHLDGGFHKGNT